MMVTRRSFLRASVAPILAGPLLAVVGCGSGQFLSPLSVSLSTITPDGTGRDDVTDVDYTLRKRANVSATLIGSDGKTTYLLRPPQTRAPDDYQIAFNGTVPVPGKKWLRVVPDGTYRFVVQAKDPTGQTVTREAPITVKNADTTPPEIAQVTVQYPTFTPNGDGDQDTTNVGYQLTKKAKVRVYATSATGAFNLILAPKTLDAGMLSFAWDGTDQNGNVLPDGKYDIHIEATDLAGNFTDYVTKVAIANGGTPRASISSVKFTPTAIAVGGSIHVEVTVKNTGTVPIKTLGPPSGYTFQTDKSYASIVNDKGIPIYYERAGVWRVAVGWQNEAIEYPCRWGFFGADYLKKNSNGQPDGSGTFSRDLLPGEQVVVTGTITIAQNLAQINSQRFFAALEQGGVGFPTGQVGQTNITIGY